MVSIETLAAFFGWCTVINFGFLVGLLLRGFVVRKFAPRVFGVTAEEAKVAQMNVFVHYRNATLLLSLTPYIALKIMA